MSWVYLLAAILLEVSGTTCMKLSEGFTRWMPAVLMFVLYGLSFTSLTFALKRIDVSVAYAIWSGFGTALIAMVGVLWFREPATAIKIISLGLIIIGVVGLNLSGGVH
jgi:small multidrug resistance pump